MKMLTLELIEEHVLNGKRFEITDQQFDTLSSSHQFLKEFSIDKIIYGINTGFGPMVQFRVEKDDLTNLQYNLIRSHSAGLGMPLSPLYAKSVVLARMISMMNGYSGVSKEIVLQLQLFFNENITPEIPEHGGVGASGDLVQLAHLGLNLIGEGRVMVDGQWKDTSKVFKEKGIQSVPLQLRDGLAIINGTSCMCGIGAINLIYAKRLLKLALSASAVINEIIESFDDSFSEELNAVKQHEGQQFVAAYMREFLRDSRLLKKRSELFSDNAEIKRSKFKNQIQVYYSLRCVPQILGPVHDTLQYAQTIIENEFNSTSDNPIVHQEKHNVFHGGNFHGDYVSLEMDKVKLVITKLTMLMERQLNYLLNDKLNNKFPSFINGGKLGFNFGYQGMQFTATSTTAENQTLSTSQYIHSIPNNNDNQDIVSMGTNGALITKKVIDNAFQVMAIHFMALSHAIDLLPSADQKKLSSNTKKLHSFIRSKVDFFTHDAPLSGKTNEIIQLIKENDFLM